MKTMLEIRFDAYALPGGEDTILKPAKCGPDVAEVRKFSVSQVNHIKVDITLDEKDARIPKILDLLTENGQQFWTDRRDIYTEDDLQAAHLLRLNGWWKSSASGGLKFGTTYDRSQACPTCGTGVRQTSPLILDDEDMRTVDKHRVATSVENDLLLRDTDVENLVAAKVTGALFWPASVKRKSGVVEELRWQQAVIENVMPKMAASSSLDRKGVCSTCHRGGFAKVMNQSLRTVYRADDLVNVQDFNVTWEFFGDLRKAEDGGIRGIRWSDPLILVSPKVMNLLRGKTKKEQKYQGCDFIPIWIEDDDGHVSLGTTGK